MKIIRLLPEMQAQSVSLRHDGRKIGFVPTMGCLHAGHVSLIKIARERCDCVILSIFVNPSQFGPEEDYDRYPRLFDEDIRICEEAGVDIVFSPDAKDMYCDSHSTWVEEVFLGVGLCGESRPGHFRGVATIVVKLLNIVSPNMMVLGQKDAQQARILQQVIRDLNIPVDIIVAPTIRECDGLALSSRNRYLSTVDRRRAASIYRGLMSVRKAYAQGVKSVCELKKEFHRIVDPELGAEGMEYLEIVDPLSLRPVVEAKKGSMVVIAVKVGGTRLIDNMLLL